MLYAIAIVVTRAPGSKYALKINDHAIEYTPESADAIVSGLAEKAREAAGTARFTVYEDNANDRIVLIPEAQRYKLTVSTRSKHLKIVRFQAPDGATRAQILDLADQHGALPAATGIKPWEPKTEQPQAAKASEAIQSDIVPQSETVSSNVVPMADVKPGDVIVSDLVPMADRVPGEVIASDVVPMDGETNGDIIVRDEPNPEDEERDEPEQPENPNPPETDENDEEPEQPENPNPPETDENDEEPEQPVFKPRMVAEYRHADDQVPIIAPAGGVISGQFYQIGNLRGIAAETKPAGELTSLLTAGVFTLPAASDIGIGAAVYWSAGKISASGTDKIGCALEKIAQGTEGKFIFATAF